MSNFRNLLKRNLEIRITSMTKTGTTNPQTKDTGNQGTKAKKPEKIKQRIKLQDQVETNKQIQIH